MSRWWHDERGQGLPGLALLAAALGISLFALLAAIASGDIGRQEVDTGPLVNPNIAGSLPCQEVADYARERHHLVYTGSGFRSLEPDLAEPQRSQYRSDAAFVDAYVRWRGRIAATVSGAMADLQAECELRRRRPDLPAPEPEPSPSPEALAIDGNYEVQLTGQSGGECLSPPVSLSVSHGTGTVTIGNTRSAPTGANVLDTYSGTLNPDYSFSAQFSESGASYTMSGRFEQLSDGIAIRGGILRAPGCDYDFTARRR